ncbi:hypothetical protein M9H77_23007 [Catharanthus roseus]|uniref:Uncharacterized protein n=1 Tax=Catharanthus roseus TaxID=4058 RepID=A0ACC0AS18_CATRO|nr:hypothetical protein M9H77_23007 [Catharanthus roseus]
MERMVMKVHQKKVTKQPKTKKKPIKVVYISNPMKVNTSASEFRALVQELTGQDSDNIPDHDPTNKFSHIQSVGQEEEMKKGMEVISRTVPADDDDDDAVVAVGSRHHDDHHMQQTRCESDVSFEPLDQDDGHVFMADQMLENFTSNPWYESTHAHQEQLIETTLDSVM